MEFYYDAVDRDVLILSADGGLMQDSAKHFVGGLERYIEAGCCKLIVDCTRLTRITSYGLGILVSLHKRLAKQGGDVKLASVPGVVGKIVHMSGLQVLFQIYPTVADARAAFASSNAAGDSVEGHAESTRHPHLGREVDSRNKRHLPPDPQVSGSSNVQSRALAR